MEEPIFIDDRMLKLKGKISLLEWDLPNIKNNELRKIKEEMLLKYKNEFDLCSHAHKGSEN